MCWATRVGPFESETCEASASVETGLPVTRSVFVSGKKTAGRSVDFSLMSSSSSSFLNETAVPWPRRSRPAFNFEFMSQQQINNYA